MRDPLALVGYIADFTFTQAYTYYKFEGSSYAAGTNNLEPELTAIGTVVGTVPEPDSIALLAGMVACLVLGRRKLFPKSEA